MSPQGLKIQHNIFVCQSMANFSFAFSRGQKRSSRPGKTTERVVLERMRRTDGPCSDRPGDPPSDVVYHSHLSALPAGGGHPYIILCVWAAWEGRGDTLLASPPGGGRTARSDHIGHALTPLAAKPLQHARCQWKIQSTGIQLLLLWSSMRARMADIYCYLERLCPY